MKQYLFNVLISIDQMANTLVGGDPDETISSRCGKRVGKCKLCTWLCWLLNKIDKRHCKDAIEYDEGKDEVIG